MRRLQQYAAEFMGKVLITNKDRTKRLKQTDWHSLLASKLLYFFYLLGFILWIWIYVWLISIQSLLNVPLNYSYLILTAEFHGIWESLEYESGVKTQVKHINWQLWEHDCITISLLNFSLFTFSFSSWIMSQQQFTSRIKMSTATWFRGTV